MTAEVPVWVFGRCRWVSGVCRRTTCQDVLEALLAAPPAPAPAPAPAPPPPPGAHGPDPDPDPHPHPDPASYVIVERWRGVERRLDGRVRILKVWSAWGEAQSDVQLEVRRVSEKGSLSARHRAGSTARRHRKHAKPSVSGHGHGHDQEHEVQRLMRLILAQGETIAGQLRRLREREAQIERLEAETHRERVARHGKDYVLAAYLQDADVEGGEGEGESTPRTSRPAAAAGQPGRPGKPRQLLLVEDDPAELADESDAEADPRTGLAAAAQGPVPVPAPAPAPAPAPGPGPAPEQEQPPGRDELRAQIALWEKVVKVNKRLEQQEERLVRLYVGFRRSAPDEAAVDDRKELRVALSRLQQDIEEGQRDLQANAELLTETEALLDAKRRFLRRLHIEVEAADMDTQRLLAVKENPPALMNSHSQSVQGKTPASLSNCSTQATTQSGIKSHSHDNDSNSDTGLSSLHSSSEEGVYILDTLV